MASQHAHATAIVERHGHATERLALRGPQPVQLARFTTVAVLTLALGIGANAAMFTVADALLLRPPPFDHAERLYWIYDVNERLRLAVNDQTPPSPGNFVDWRSQTRAFDYMVAWRNWWFSVAGPHDGDLAAELGNDVLLAHLKRFPQVDPSAYVAPTATVCGDVAIGARTRIMHGASIIAEGGRLEIGDCCIVMENAVIRSTNRHSTRIGRHCLVGPSAHLVGCSVASNVRTQTWCESRKAFPNSWVRTAMIRWFRSGVYDHSLDRRNVLSSNWNAVALSKTCGDSCCGNRILPRAECHWW
jgi:hypothetical protein